MFKRLIQWCEDYDFFVYLLMTFIFACLVGGIIGKAVAIKFETKLNHLEQQYAILQEHVEECIDSELCEHYKVIY